MKHFYQEKLLEDQKAILKKIDQMKDAYNKLSKKIELYYKGELDKYL